MLEICQFSGRMLGEFFGLSFGLIVTGSKFGFLSSKPPPKGSGKSANNTGGKIVTSHWSFPNSSNSDPSWISARAPSNKVKYLIPSMVQLLDVY